MLAVVGDSVSVGKAATARFVERPDNGYQPTIRKLCQTLFPGNDAALGLVDDRQILGPGISPIVRDERDRLHSVRRFAVPPLPRRRRGQPAPVGELDDAMAHFKGRTDERR